MPVFAPTADGVYISVSISVTTSWTHSDNATDHRQWQNHDSDIDDDIRYAAGQEHFTVIQAVDWIDTVRHPIAREMCAAAECLDEEEE